MENGRIGEGFPVSLSPVRRFPVEDPFAMIFSLGNVLSRIRVPMGFLLAGFYFYFSRPTQFSLLTGGIIAVLGLLVRAWATGHIRKDVQLAITGPYAFTRNPLYFGSFLIGLGFSLAGGDVLILVVFLVCFATLYGSVMQMEIDHLKTLFPEEYVRYQKRVPLFFPRLWPLSGERGKFSFDQYLKNEEYFAFLGFLAAMGLLIMKV